MTSNPRISDLTDHLGFWLRTVSNHVSQSFAAKLADRNITVAEWVVMRSLYGNEPMAPSRLAADIGMTRGAITKLADRLIAKSLIIRRSSEEDGRAQTLGLTKRGVELVPQLAVLADGNDAEFFGTLSAGERRTLEKLLRRLAEQGDMRTMPID
ncbi:MarR family winged helix-turn-helix transcriptional regulator [Hyphomicrobium sp.]|jgi:DNA-binding MarR family transcriptional regulator|uniref:MarR family winged helix-turn-helix transcriptional regulator n=1 Tax=Hyphomicrobium sp. TaxID=82 RepID=UPI003569E912